MKLRVVLPTFAALLLIPASPAAAKGVFTLGNAAGEVTSSSAILWAHAATSGPVTLKVGKNARLSGKVITRALQAKGSVDNTVQTRLSGLKPGTRYFYRWFAGRQSSPVGRFVTAPAETASEDVSFAFSGDADAERPKGKSKPAYNNFEVYDRMRREGNDFNVNLGDTIYSDSEQGTTVAKTRKQKWAKYRQNLALSNLAKLRGSTGLYSHWDDHEFINDFSVAENGRKIYTAGVQAFRDYAPVGYSSRDGLYRSFRWGQNLELFFLDERSFRSAKASAGGVCDNGGSPDLAPTAPQSTRSTFSLLVPALANPAPPGCVAAINDPSRTFLGQRQFERFTQAIKASPATWKIIINETPIQQFYALPYDRWEGYAAEREKLLSFLETNVKNVVFLTTDVHANYVNDARFKTLEPGGPVNSGILDITVGPVATKTFVTEINETTGNESAGTLVQNIFFKPAPPSGLGMRCAQGDVSSYGQVDVTATKLTVTLKDLRGNGVNDADGKTPCGPYVLTPK